MSRLDGRHELACELRVLAAARFDIGENAD
jgi:hypothetical protein